MDCDTRKKKISLLEGRVLSVIKGKGQAIRLAISALLSRGHLLIEDVPGVGKTTLAFTLASAIDCSFQRIQFTSDMMPTDIIGVSVYNKSKSEFELKKGPVFTNVILADEINRTTPKTQSALLEAMNDRRVSVERVTYTLPEPFMVIATQNPMEYMGTFPLPESQLDRFAMHLKLGYPQEIDEREAILGKVDFDVISSMPPVISADEIVAMQAEAEHVKIEDSVLAYIMDIVAATRDNNSIRLGLSTRGAQHLVKVSRAFAYLDGRDFVTPDDVKSVAPSVIGHRIMLKRQGAMDLADSIVHEILDSLIVPV